jgi:hypothetical protein
MIKNYDHKDLYHLTANLFSKWSWTKNGIMWNEIKSYLATCSWYIIVMWDEVKSYNGVLLTISDDIKLNELSHGEMYLLYGILNGYIY